jgi:hypothetical protein
LAVRTPSAVHNNVVEKKRSESNKVRKVIMVKEKVTITPMDSEGESALLL